MIVKRILTTSFFILSLSPAFAINPIPGVYGGVIVGGSGQLGIDSPFVNPLNDLLINSDTEIGQKIQALSVPNSTLSDTLSYSILGLIGGQLGYRWHQTRLEAELFYNSAPFSSLRISNGVEKITISSNDTSRNYISGSTGTLAVMLNAFYDLLPPDYYDSSFAPFVGIGGGYVSVNNTMQFYLGGQELQFWNIDETKSAAGGQVMAGVLYFLDDFSNFGVDVRFFSSTNISSTVKDIPYSYNVQIFSVNLTFNGAFNFG